MKKKLKNKWMGSNQKGRKKDLVKKSWPRPLGKKKQSNLKKQRRLKLTKILKLLSDLMNF